MSIEELIEIEQNYIKAHSNSLKIPGLNDCDKDDDLDFLQRGDIKRHFDGIRQDTKAELKRKGLSDFEILMLICFVGNLSYAFRYDNYEDKPTPIQEMCDGLDSVLNKAPIYSEEKKLYRFCTDDDKLDFHLGEEHRFPNYLTTTKSLWRTNDNMYIITPKKDETSARCIYELRNHENENQVTFKRGTTFVITGIEDDGENKKIYMTEL